MCKTSFFLRWLPVRWLKFFFVVLSTFIVVIIILLIAILAKLIVHELVLILHKELRAPLDIDEQRVDLFDVLDLIEVGCTA